jgi:hypothetical protein
MEKAVTGHTHTPQDFMLFPSGKRIDVCDCGATREVETPISTPQSWHTCERCTQPYGRERRKP